MSRNTAFGLAVVFAMSSFTAAQEQPAPGPYTCTMLSSARTQETGCYIIGTEKIDHLPAGPLFWHLYTYPTLEQAERGQQESGGIVAESLGKVWLFKIAAENWRPTGGDRVTVIGPLEVSQAKRYEARYIEAVIPPGRPGTPVHRHPGPEAWYVLSGSQCMQTPAGTRIVRNHETAVIPGGVPMAVKFPFNETVRHIVLVLYDASQPWRTKAQDWTPTTTCPSQ
jgi:quercetin dioxygenase-like cupin family protein